MSFPFGSTAFGTYLAWATSVGCECNNGYNSFTNTTCWRITAPSGRRVVVVDMEQSERLTTSMLNYLDRRLGLTSPFDRA